MLMQHMHICKHTFTLTVSDLILSSAWGVLMSIKDTLASLLVPFELILDIELTIGYPDFEMIECNITAAIAKRLLSLRANPPPPPPPRRRRVPEIRVPVRYPDGLYRVLHTVGLMLDRVRSLGHQMVLVRRMYHGQ